MRNYPAIIGVGGYARTGKDTVATILHALYGYHRVAFADILKDVAYAANPIIGARPRWAGSGDYVGQDFVHLRDVVDEIGWDAAKEQYPEVRLFLQGLGVGARDHIDSNVWVDAAFRLAPSGLIVIPDVRFPNEFDKVVEMGGTMWRVNRPGISAANAHVSETALDDYVFDRYIENDSSQAVLADKIIDALDVQAWQRDSGRMIHG